MSQSNKPLSSYTEDNDYEFSDKKTRNKIVKHLSDINDTISDEDISNVITDISSGQPADKIQPATTNVLGEDAVIPDDESLQMPTSWNIIE